MQATGQNPNRTVTAFRVTSRAALRRLEGDWGRLLIRSECENIFLTFDWMSEWWYHHGKNHALFVVVVWNADGDLVGLAPLYIAAPSAGKVGLRKLCFLADHQVGSDYLSILTAKGYESQATDAMADCILEHARSWDYMEFRNCQVDDLVFRRLVMALKRRGLQETVTKSTVCPYIPLPDSFETYLAGLSSNVRYNFKRRLARLEKKGRLRFVTLTDEEAITARLADLLRLHRLRFDQKNQRSTFLHPDLHDFFQQAFKRIARRGRLRLHFLEIDGQPIATLCNFSIGKRIQFYQSGMDPAWSRWSPGFVLMGLTIAEAIREGYTEFDFLQGAEKYKFRWTAHKREMFTVCLFDQSLRSQLALAANALVRKSMSLKRRLLQDSDGHPEPKNGGKAEPHGAPTQKPGNRVEK